MRACRNLWRLGAFMLLVSPFVQSETADQSSVAFTTTGPWHVSVEAVATDQLSLDVRSLYPRSDVDDKTSTIPGAACASQELTCKRLHLVVVDSVVKSQLKQIHQGDHIEIVYSVDSAGNQNVLKAWSLDEISVSPGLRVLVLLGSAGVCFLLYAFFSQWDPRQLIIGEDNRYSNSLFQVALWFFVLIATYLATLALRVWAAGWDFTGGVNIPSNLLLLSGMSAITFGGAKAITTFKNQPAATQKAKAPDAPRQIDGAGGVQQNQAVAPQNAEAPDVPRQGAEAGAPNQPPVKKTRAAAPNFLMDLTHNDGTDKIGRTFDFGDFQMVIVTLIAVATYLVLIFNFLGVIEYSKVISLPDVDTTLLASFGLGQGAYLTKKAVGDLGSS